MDYSKFLELLKSCPLSLSDSVLNSFEDDYNFKDGEVSFLDYKNFEEYSLKLYIYECLVSDDEILVLWLMRDYSKDDKGDYQPCIKIRTFIKSVEKEELGEYKIYEWKKRS